MRPLTIQPLATCQELIDQFFNAGIRADLLGPAVEQFLQLLFRGALLGAKLNLLAVDVGVEARLAVAHARPEL